MKTLSIKECLSFGWQTFKSRPWIFIGAGAVIVAIEILTNILTSSAELLDETSAMYSIVGLVVFVISLIVSVLTGTGTINFLLKAHDDVSSAKIKDLWCPRPFWRYLAAMILVGLMVLIGFILLVIPGIFLALALAFVLNLVVDKDMGFREAIKRSFELTKGYRWKLLLLSLAILGLNILGLLALIVGLVVSIPVTYLASMHAYRTLSRAGAETEVTSEASAATAG